MGRGPYVTLKAPDVAVIGASCVRRKIPRQQPAAILPASLLDLQIDPPLGLKNRCVERDRPGGSVAEPTGVGVQGLAYRFRWSEPGFSQIFSASAVVVQAVGEFAGLYAEALRQLQDRRQARLATASLDPADAGQVDTGGVGQAVLR